MDVRCHSRSDDGGIKRQMGQLEPASLCSLVHGVDSVLQCTGGHSGVGSSIVERVARQRHATVHAQDGARMDGGALRSTMNVARACSGTISKVSAAFE